MRGLPVIQIYSLNVNKGLSYQIKYVISKFQKNKSNENSLKILFEKVLFLCIAHFLLKFLRQRISLSFSALWILTYVTLSHFQFSTVEEEVLLKKMQIFFNFKAMETDNILLFTYYYATKILKSISMPFRDFSSQCSKRPTHSLKKQ